MINLLNQNFGHFKSTAYCAIIYLDGHTFYLRIFFVHNMKYQLQSQMKITKDAPITKEYICVSDSSYK